MVVTMTGSEWDIWRQEAGAFHGVFQNTLHEQLPLSLLLCKGISGYSIASGEVLKGYVALKELKSKNQSCFVSP